jgi:transposase
MVEDLRILLREFTGRKSQPTAMILDSRTLQSTPESGARGGYDGAKRRKGSKVHVAVDEDAPQRDYALRDVFNALRYIAKTGCHWRMLPNDLPPWTVVYQQMRRWIDARCFEIIVEDLRILLREFSGRKGQPTAMILDSPTLQPTPESGGRGGYDGAKRRKGSKVHAAVDTLGHLLALHVTAADEQDRAQVGMLAEAVQDITGESVELAVSVLISPLDQREE